MNMVELRARFFALVPSHPPNAWEIEEHLENIAPLRTAHQELVLSQVPAIWPVSHSLCYSYLAAAGRALDCLAADQLLPWVRDILDTYEKEGLHAAQHFMADVETHFLCRLRGEAGLDFAEAAKRLTSYARSIMGRNITLTPDASIYTDTEFIYLPPRMTQGSSETENFLLYKLAVTFQLGFLLQGTYELELPGNQALIQSLRSRYSSGKVPETVPLEEFFTLFPAPRLAEDIFTALEVKRVSRYIASAFPGLWRDTAMIRSTLAAARPQPPRSLRPAQLLEVLIQYVLTGRTAADACKALNSRGETLLAEFSRPAVTAADSAAGTAAIYALLPAAADSYVPVPPVYYAGRLNPAAARRGLLRRRARAKEAFVKLLASVILQHDGQDEKQKPPVMSDSGKQPALPAEKGAGMLIFTGKKRETTPQALKKPETTRFLTLEGPLAQLPEPLRTLTAEINADLGHIPSDYIAAAQGMAGRAALPVPAAGNPSGASFVAPLTYDEWDYRRQGFRKDWCSLREKQVQPVKGTFVQATLDKYQGLLRQLKKQFEILRSRERFVKRQRDGDDIDLDALIESIADTRAGKGGTERLFIRLQRDERDTAILFLVDMSSSTEGWISQALKEALILMGEALQVLGDRFAICGFSGMRRLRSDFYRIKNFGEPYTEEIQERIAAIAPQEYTRMGPPLRHAVRLLQEVDAKVRLLMVLSDGKPEDYDDYKGEYAIEDTRHALIEAKAAGIHPFCITIDKQAHDYIAHMYGEVNYIFLDEVRKLPLRLPEIYRLLTT